MRRISGVLVLVALFSLGFSQAKTADPDKAQLTKLEKAYKTSKSALAKKPKNAKLKTAFVKATVAYGTATMKSPTLSPKDKYPGALRLYREALKLDPKNKEALDNKKMIEDIYTQMGRPIPK